MKTLAAWLRERLRCFLGFYTLEEEVRQLHNCVVNMKMKAIEKKALAIIQEKTHSPLIRTQCAIIAEELDKLT